MKRFRSQFVTCHGIFASSMANISSKSEIVGERFAGDFRKLQIYTRSNDAEKCSC
jgi:hypothetical protein